jgi:hypothetical protein
MSHAQAASVRVAVAWPSGRGLVNVRRPFCPAENSSGFSSGVRLIPTCYPALLRCFGIGEQMVNSSGDFPVAIAGKYPNLPFVPVFPILNVSAGRP